MSSAGANAGVSAGAIHRLVVFGDAVGSGTLGMDAKRLMRAAMYEAFGEAYAAIGVEPGTVHQEDRGDGILGALRPDVPPAFMVGRWIDTLYESLREHNAGRRERLRMRVGMNAGLVLDDGRGLVGRAVDLACRLCDSPTAKRVMEAAPDADLLVVVSDWLYGNVVVEGGRYVEPSHYRQARVLSKETDETAWFHIPRRPAPPLPPFGEAESGRGRQAEGRGDTQTGGGPARGDGPPPPVPEQAVPEQGRGEYYDVGGDLQVFRGNTIHGGFTGIRKERPASGARASDEEESA
ncbi:hypothetical protein [Streptomyces lateritius]|uniref:hypothetical protein n=1 Tax=Streptomyces lateritius TaxID=67313 RepID=UPI0019CF2B89|nr:hypothetical protein [Streptomyces lateritius]GGT97673.1 hypothetical protein GCM10010272_48080 [Streptomyces lateritius]